jgi:ATP-binding cassette subfamily C protein
VEDGQIAERGTHEELLERGGRYAELHRTQFAVQKDVAPDEEPASDEDPEVLSGARATS